jgi:hypothetical protein
VPQEASEEKAAGPFTIRIDENRIRAQKEDALSALEAVAGLKSGLKILRLTLALFRNRMRIKWTKIPAVKVNQTRISYCLEKGISQSEERSVEGKPVEDHLISDKIPTDTKYHL